MIDPLFTMALITGLLGSGHCIGMCGGIVTALSLSDNGRRSGLSFHLLYNAGRLATYGLIGFLAGRLGSAIAYTDAFAGVSRSLLVASDLLVIFLGLGTAGLFARFTLQRLEFAGPMRAMASAVQGMRALPPAIAALPLGLLFGFLPCGFLYAVAISAAQSADPLQGALVLLAFGLGTAPSLLLFGKAAQWLGVRARARLLQGAGIMVAAMGGYNLFRHLQMMGLWGLL
jgi:sulfite exporter TauE/SafE